MARVETFDYEVIQSPVGGGEAVTLSDVTEYENTRGFQCGVGGDLKVTFADGSETTLYGLIAGLPYPYRIKKFWSTGTTGVQNVTVLY